jgi:hypothetical protein
MRNDFVGSSNYLAHYGIQGMKWGVRRYQNADGSLTEAGKAKYRSTSLRGLIAKRKNEKINKSFEKWKKGAADRERAINLGKTANEKKLAYESDKSNAEKKAAYKQAHKEYKKAYTANTTYRKGQVKGEVYSDISRKYLSEAKKLEKQLSTNPQLQKEYNKLMSAHDVYRAKARRAPEAYANRSRKIASMKAVATMTVKAAAATAVIGAGVYFANKYVLKNKNIRLNSSQVRSAITIGKQAAKVLRYF